jgi:dihydrofolate reductase
LRKIIVLSFITLDGVMQSPGRPEEDPSGGFQYGGWSSSYNFEDSGEVMEKQLELSDLLLGRKTFEMFEAYWPSHADYWPGFQEVTKYVLSSTLKSTTWKNSIILESLADIEKLKNSGDADLKIWGSSKLVQLLLKHDLVDELWLNIHPIILGKGKKLFNDDAFPATFTLVESLVTAYGVIMANYKRDRAVKTGVIAP